MIRSLVRTVSATAALLLTAGGLAAQSVPRVVLAPQVGAAVQQSRFAEVGPMASLAAEWRQSRLFALTVEGTAALDGHADAVCYDTAICSAGTAIRAGLLGGVVIRPFRLGGIAPYVGGSAGVGRWKEGEASHGFAPLATLRAGVDAHVAGPFGVRADYARRALWNKADDHSTLHADVLSLGATFGLGR